MSFQPNPGDSIRINGKTYTVGQHPAAPGLAYAQAGRQGIVYQLLPVEGGMHEAKALKVFFPKYRVPAMVYQSETMEIYSECPGLQVCKRDVLTPERNGELIAEHPDLLYAVLMPWIFGVTWFDMIADQRQLKRTESLSLAKALSGIGSGMEQRRLAHCDLSAPNVMLPFFSEVDLPDNSSAVELVDVEQMYSPKMDRPDVLLSGSPGYAAHRTVQSGLWSAYADRFAGAIILSEMLGWCDPHVVEKAWGESYFDQHEMQNACERYFVLKKSLERNWGAPIADLFSRAWESQDVSSCPTFGEWLVTLSSIDGEQILQEEIEIFAVQQEGEEQSGIGAGAVEAAAALPAVDPEAKETHDGSSPDRQDDKIVRRLFLQARELEGKGNLGGALELYKSAHHFVPAGSPLQIELEAAIRGLEETLNAGPVDNARKVPFYRSPKWLAVGAAVLLLIGGSGIAVNQILADRTENRKAAAEALLKQQEEAKQQEAKRQEEAERQEEAKQAALKIENDEKKLQQAQAEKKRQQEEAQKLAQQKAEKQKLQEKYDQQAKYEAYLAQQKLIEEKKKEAERKRLQELQDKQAKYEAEQKRKQIELAKKEAARKEAATKARELEKRRAKQVVLLISYYNQAYNAQIGGKMDKARTYSIQFTRLYEKDAQYFKKVGKVGTRANAIYKFLSNYNYDLPNI